MFGLPHGEAIAAAFPRGELVRLEGRGHEIHLDPEVARIVVEFLKRTNP
jgi:hypothetical protein